MAKVGRHEMSLKELTVTTYTKMVHNFFSVAWGARLEKVLYLVIFWKFSKLPSRLEAVSNKYSDVTRSQRWRKMLHKINNIFVRTVSLW